MSETPQIEHKDLIELIRENVHDLIAVINSNRRRVWFNDAYSSTLGFTREELESGDSTSTLHPDDIEKIRNSFEEAMSTGRGRALEYRMQHKNGSWVWLESRSRVMSDVPGIGKCLILVARNITQRKEREAQREAAEQRLQAQKKALIDLTHAPELQGSDLEALTWKVATVARSTLAGAEVSVWWLQGSDLQRQGSTRGGRGWETRPKGVALSPEQMSGLEQTRIQVQSDGARDALAAHWQSTGSAAANLQVTLRRGGCFCGLLVCAAEVPARTWHVDEQSFAESLGAILMQSLEARERRLAFAALKASQEKLAAELADAAAYVQALLPPPSSTVPVTDWIFVPSTELGGDAFGYHWIDEDHFAIYLLDVCGHGVGAALLSISALNVLRSASLPGIDFRSPVQVMEGVNHTFDMDRQNNMYFTLWYGVWHRTRQEIRCCCGGHPPALLFPPGDKSKARLLGKPGLVVGAMPGVSFVEDCAAAASGSSLLLFSDGVYEVTRPDGTLWTLDDFNAAAVQGGQNQDAPLSGLVEAARRVRGEDLLEDDFSLLRVRF